MKPIPQPAKRPQSIIGNLSSMYCEENYPGEFNMIDFLDWVARGQHTHVIAQREMLESYDGVRQAQMYNVVMRACHVGYEYLVYQRTPKGGEPTLHDKVSIGWGGHTDLAMAVIDPLTSVLNFGATMITALETEMDEELKIADASGKKIRFVEAFRSKIGTGLLLQDTKPEIFHAGIVNFIEVDQAYDFDTNEDEITMLGWFSSDQIKEQFGSQLESWTKLILENEGKFGNIQKYLDQAQLDSLPRSLRYVHFLEEMTGLSAHESQTAVLQFASQAWRRGEYSDVQVARTKPGEKRSNTLAEYFLNSPAIDHSVRAEERGGIVRFYIHPQGMDGETMDFEVDRNFCHPLNREQVIGNEMGYELGMPRNSYENIGPSEAEVEIHVYSRVRQIGRARIAHAVKNALNTLGYHNVDFAADPRMPDDYVKNLDFSHLDNADANKRNNLKISIHKFR